MSHYLNTFIINKIKQSLILKYVSIFSFPVMCTIAIWRHKILPPANGINMLIHYKIRIMIRVDRTATHIETSNGSCGLARLHYLSECPHLLNAGGNRLWIRKSLENRHTKHTNINCSIALCSLKVHSESIILCSP